MNDSLADCETLGNTALFDLEKTAFLCSRRVPATAILKIYDFARRAAEQKICVMSGFHTTLEKDVRELLADGDARMVWVCARGIIRKPPGEVRAAMDDGRLLVVSPFAGDIRRPTRQFGHVRNLFVLRNAARVVVGHAAPGGALAAALAEGPPREVTYLSEAEQP